MKKKSFKEMLLSPRRFPLEITLTTGGKHRIIHPDYTHVHPNGTVFIFRRNGGFPDAIDPRHIVKTRSLRKLP